VDNETVKERLEAVLDDIVRVCAIAEADTVSDENLSEAIGADFRITDTLVQILRSNRDAFDITLSEFTMPPGTTSHGELEFVDVVRAHDLQIHLVVSDRHGALWWIVLPDEEFDNVLEWETYCPSQVAHIDTEADYIDVANSLLSTSD
jgi:hypothetical protein